MGSMEAGMWVDWDSPACDEVARRDFISPPTGIELGKVLRSMYNIPEEGLPAQIIRWG